MVNPIKIKQKLTISSRLWIRNGRRKKLNGILKVSKVLNKCIRVNNQMIKAIEMKLKHQKASRNHNRQILKIGSIHQKIIRLIICNIYLPMVDKIMI